MMMTTLHFNLSIAFISFDARLHNHLRALHHTGSQIENPVVPEEPEEQLEVQQQEVTEAEEEVGEDLPECPDHRPSSFERGKPRSISLPVCK
jgi:uncharacterized membrane protein (UPF0127 family)